MATIVTYDGGLKRIEFSLTPCGPRKILRLGSANAATAKCWKARVEAIIGDKLASRPHDAELSKWLGDRDESMLARMRAVGLADGVGLSHTTLGEFLERCFATMGGKEGTKTFYGHTRRNLEDFFGAGRLLRDITTADADAFRSWLMQHDQTGEDGKKHTKKLSAATVARRIIATRTIWRKAIRWKLAGENPFTGIKGGHQENDTRKAFIRRDAIDKLLEAAPDVEWKLIIALARYGGVRTPSETFALKWGHIDWEHGRFTVHSAKTEHHKGKGTRTVPIFPELRPLLIEAFEQAEAGTEYVIARHRLTGLNLRTQFERIIQRAELTLWPRLFQNLRASRETELMREYDLTTACRWIGNSPAVAAKHYAMSMDLDGDFSRAAGPDRRRPGEAQQNAQQSADGGTAQPMTSPSPESEKALENQGFVAACPMSASADMLGGWAIQDSNL